LSKNTAEKTYTLNFNEPNSLTQFFRKMEGVSPLRTEKIIKVIAINDKMIGQQRPCERMFADKKTWQGCFYGQ